MRQLGCNDFFFGLDAPTTARTVGLPTRRGEYFLSKRKKVPKKACGTALREKGFYCPFWRRGSQCRAQWSWTAFTSFWSALVLAFFRRQNGRAFSLRCLSPLCSSAGGARRTKPMQVAMSWHRLDGFAEQKNRLVFLLWLALSIRKQRRLGYFNNWIPATQKASWISYPRWPF